MSYAEWGWPVIPLLEKNKTPLTSHGLMDSSTDVKQINDWWDRWPNANVGLRTGILFDVLDLDGPGAKRALAHLAPKYIHDGPISSTGKGYHLLFKASGSKNHTKLAEAPIDYRGVQGYIVAPPSVHPNGHRYVWARETLNLPELPEWLRPLVFPPKLERTTPMRDPAILESIAKSGSILDVLSRIVPGEIQRVGDNYVTYCPFHKDDTASLVIYSDTNSFFCFGCSAWGDPLNVRRWIRTGRLRRNEKIRTQDDIV